MDRSRQNSSINFPSPFKQKTVMLLTKLASKLLCCRKSNLVTQNLKVLKKCFLCDIFADEVQASGVQDASDGREAVKDDQL